MSRHVVRCPKTMILICYQAISDTCLFMFLHVYKGLFFAIPIFIMYNTIQYTNFIHLGYKIHIEVLPIVC